MAIPPLGATPTTTSLRPRSSPSSRLHPPPPPLPSLPPPRPRPRPPMSSTGERGRGRRPLEDPVKPPYLPTFLCNSAPPRRQIKPWAYHKLLPPLGPPSRSHLKQPRLSLSPSCPRRPQRRLAHPLLHHQIEDLLTRLRPPRLTRRPLPSPLQPHRQILTRPLQRSRAVRNRGRSGRIQQLRPLPVQQSPLWQLTCSPRLLRVLRPPSLRPSGKSGRPITLRLHGCLHKLPYIDSIWPLIMSLYQMPPLLRSPRRFQRLPRRVHHWARRSRLLRLRGPSLRKRRSRALSPHPASRARV